MTRKDYIERLADALHEAWLNEGPSEWLAVAYRAIELFATPKLACGHPAELLVKSVESEYQFCDLCECRSRRNDAEKMERELTRERDEARAEAERLRSECEREHPPEPEYAEWIKAGKPSARVLGLPSEEELEGMLRESDSVVWLEFARRLHAALSALAPEPAAAPALDVERLGWCLRTEFNAGEIEMRGWPDYAKRVIAAYGATALPPIPQGDEGPKALRFVVFGDGYESWEDTTEEARNDYRAQWAEAVRLLRHDAAQEGQREPDRKAVEG